MIFSWINNVYLYGLILLVVFFPRQVLAHPSDVSFMELNIQPASHPVPDFNIDVKFYLSWSQTVMLAEKNSEKTGLIPEFQPKKTDFISYVTQTLNTNQKYFQDYFIQNVLLQNDGQDCVLNFFSIPVQDKKELLFGRGIQMDAVYKCSGKIGQIYLKNTIFIDQFKLQTNNVSFQLIGKSEEKIVFNKDKTEFTFNIIKPFPLPTVIIAKNTDPHSNLIARLGNNLLNLDQKSTFQVLVIVFLLGLLHTLEAGHDKSILITMMLNKQTKIVHSLVFILVFIVTHLSDIFVLGGLFFLVNSFTDVYNKLPYLQRLSVYLLFIISIVILFKNIRHLFNHTKSIDHVNQHNQATKLRLKKQLILGIITGLSPCLFGWSIFLFIVTTRNLWLVFPIMISFGMGILTSLLIVALLINFLKVKLYGRWQKIADWSPLISAVILVVISLLMVLKG